MFRLPDLLTSTAKLFEGFEPLESFACSLDSAYFVLIQEPGSATAMIKEPKKAQIEQHNEYITFSLDYLQLPAISKASDEIQLQ